MTTPVNEAFNHVLDKNLVKFTSVVHGILNEKSNNLLDIMRSQLGLFEDDNSGPNDPEMSIDSGNDAEQENPTGEFADFDLSDSDMEDIFNRIANDESFFSDDDSEYDDSDTEDE